MIVSMTGFGVHQHKSEDVEISATVKSLNGRFLDVRFHLPREYSGYETELKSKVATHISRGTVEVYVHRRFPAHSRLSEVVVDKAVARKWLKAYRELGQAVGIQEPLTWSVVAAWPEVLRLETHSKVSASERSQLFKVVEKAAMLCAGERKREGAALSKEIKRYYGDLERLLGGMSKHIAAANTDMARRFNERMARSPYSEKVDAQRLAQEVAVFLDRCDVSEEIQRLKEHLRNCQSLLSDSAPQGKKLDFYAQELLREVNTIGSKSQIAPLTDLVVEAKATIEKIKEQVQNIA